MQDRKPISAPKGVAHGAVETRRNATPPPAALHAICPVCFAENATHRVGCPNEFPSDVEARARAIAEARAAETTAAAEARAREPLTSILRGAFAALLRRGADVLDPKGPEDAL